MRATSPTQAMAQGIGLVPEDRHRDGLMLGMSIRDNLVMTTLGRFHRTGLLQPRRITTAPGRRTDRPAPERPAPQRLADRRASLSGGNQQKVLIGKWLVHASLQS